MGKEGNRVPRRNGRNKIYSICAFLGFQLSIVSEGVPHHVGFSLARLSKCFEVMLENFFVYLQTLYATDRLFQPPSLNDCLLSFNGKKATSKEISLLIIENFIAPWVQQSNFLEI